MKKLYALGLMLLAPLAPLLACDVCSAVGGQYPGIFPEWNKPWLQLRQGYQSFRYPHNPARGTVREHFYAAELSGRWNPLPRLQLQARLPLAINTQTMDNEQPPLRLWGMGDPVLQASFIPWMSPDSSERRFKHQLSLGGGVQLPLGKDDWRDSRGIAYAPGLQPGTGAWGAQAHLNYILRSGNWGWQGQYSLLHFRESQTQLYRFGNRHIAGLSAFYWAMREGWSILPSAGLSYEHAAPDYHLGWPLENGGSKRLMGQIGLDVFRNNWTLGLQVQLPLWQQIKGTEPQHQGRVWLNLGYRLG